MPASFGGWSGRSYGWRYLAQRFDGSGLPGIWLANELPLQDVTITDVLSGPPQLTASIPTGYLEMKGSDGGPLLGEWATIIYAECDGQIRAGTILVGSGFKSGMWNLDCSGFSTVLTDMPYPSMVTFRQTDPLDIVRHIWFVTQLDPAANLGVVVDNVTHTPVLIGAPEVVVTDTTQASTSAVVSTTTDTEGYELNWWSTDDLGGKVDELAKLAPFAYHERHSWNADQTAVNHYMDFGYPTIGRRRENLRFVVGENIQHELEPDRDGDEYANDVIVLGAGEGSAMVRGQARRNDGRVRRVKTVSDKNIEDPAHAQRAARIELAYRQQLTQVKTVAIRESQMAPIGSFGVGDEIRVQGMTDWMDVDVWARVLSLSITPDAPDIMGAQLMRTDGV
jgi:hypothetical protein